MTIYNENAVPILFRGPDQKIGLSPEANATVEKAQSAALKAIESNGTDAYDKHYLTGESVVIHCQQLSPSEEAGKVFVSVGAETLDEALKSIIAAYDLAHLHPAQESSDHLSPPDWVASTHKQLGELLADYYSCANLPIDEVL
jgi:hypothetical protein